MEYLIIIGCILIACGIVTLIFFQWLKIMKMLKERDEAGPKIDFPLYLYEEDERHVL
jgi:hypothetical protein